MPTTGPVSGRLFIWYPHFAPDDVDEDDPMIGHASLYLGNYEVGRRYEMALDPNSPTGVVPSALEQSLGLWDIHFNDNYVSWWPTEGRAGRARPKLGLYADINAEKSEPHVVYDLYGLDLVKMRHRWKEIRDKPGASYDMFRKNCADIVHRVLISGGALKLLPLMLRGWHSRNVFGTPKKVAQLGNALRDAGWAIKTKAGNCPSKSEVGRHVGPLRGMLR